ncbi:MAG: hydroxymethylpyrimidine/phosphomethylpyrimidine kinase [Gammaproteobacteria bacterium]|nr:hydroxymethylpyrimidine/phosphomethylpyrimidine kinase [Gammaproteobacteria bacterium]
MTNQKKTPVTLCFSGHDPSGGAGLQADIEAITAHGGHACTIVTALTTQDTRNIQHCEPVSADKLIQQAHTLLDDINIAAIKIGLLGSLEIIEAIAGILQEIETIPVILDPVLRAGGGTSISDQDMCDAIKQQLLPLSHIVTPNSEEARHLFPAAETLDQCAQEMINAGCPWVLITGGHEPGQHIINTLYNEQGIAEQSTWDRLAGEYHGSGCTLAASIASLIAQGMDTVIASNEAQHYTWECLNHARRIGQGQGIPNRLFWAQE